MFDFNILQQGNGEHRWPSGHYDVGGWDQVREGGRRESSRSCNAS